MAIGARTSPELVVVGTVSQVRARNWEGEYRGNRVTVDTDGGPLVVGFSEKQDADVPQAGSLVALVTSVYDGPQGSSLSFVRRLSPNDLDLLVSASGLAASK